MLAERGERKISEGLLNEVSTSKTHNEEDYFLQIAPLIKSKIVADQGIAENLRRRSSHIQEEFGLTESSKLRSGLFSGHLLTIN